jgi:radical SAM superfamily enzyme YgiQ (UPF0313 family)
MEILLAYKANFGAASDPFTSLLPIGLGYINASLRTMGFRSKVANFSRFSWREIERCLDDQPPAILGISQFTHNRFDSLKLARLAKEINPSCIVVLGGPHATHRFHEILTRNLSVDYVVLGEGEETFCELAGSLSRDKENGVGSVRGIAYRSAGSIATSPPREPLADLDALPVPAAFFDSAIGVDIHRQLEFIVTSRGCPASCRFCSSPNFWGRTLRFRSPESIVDEIKFIKNRYGLIHFSIRDDTFTADRKRVVEFCRLLIQEKVYVLWNCQSRVNAVDEDILFWMKRAGCECIQFGVESGSVRVLRELGKRITTEQIRKAADLTRRAGMHLSLYLMTGIPGENEDDLKDTLALIEGVKASDGQVSPLVYYPGTSLIADGVASGMIQKDLFEADRREALSARSDAFVGNSVRALLKRLESVAEKNIYTGVDYQAQKKALGYCHATNIMAGELYESQGKWREAEREYREISDREPENPWGWLMTGELNARRKDFNRARQAFERLSTLVPAHAPAFSHLGDLCRQEGDYAAAHENYRKALSLDPYDAMSHDGLKRING